MLTLNSKRLFNIYTEIRRIILIAYHHPGKIFKAVIVLFQEGPKGVKNKIRRQDILEDYQAFINAQYYKAWKKFYPSKSELQKQKIILSRLKYRPKISILLPTFNTPQKYLIQCIESVLNQSYDNWQLCIADDASDNKYIRHIVEKYAKLDPRIDFIFREKRGHISKATNSALKIASGEYVGFLDHDDLLWPNALFEVVKVLNNKKVKLIYSDEDKLDEDGSTHLEPFFKPDFSPDYLRSINYFVHFTVIERSLVKKIGGLRVRIEGAQDWDLFLRATNKLNKEDVFHIPKVLYSWRKSPESSSSEKSTKTTKRYAFENQKKVLENDLRERGLKGEVLRTQYNNFWRVKYEVLNSPLVSIVIPTKDNFGYINRCLNSIINKTLYKNFEIIIVDTGTKDSKVFGLYDNMRNRFKNIKVFNWEYIFNFSLVCNFGAKQANGKYIIFLNNDTQIITKRWIENLLEHAQRPNVGAVGCKLLFPNGRIQHVGVVLGLTGGKIKKGVAGHPFKNFYHKKINNDYARIVDVVVNYCAVTAACMMVSKEKLLKVGGFDPNLRIAFNDVDFCLKLYKKGYFNVYTPYTILIHHESISVGKPGRGDRSAKEFFREVKLMRRRWGELLLNDPYYNKNLTLNSEERTIEI